MSNPAGDLGMSRREMYRLAGRTLRYNVYVVLEALWAICAIYVVFNDLLMSASTQRYLFLLAIISISHSTKMTLTEPWQLLKASLLAVTIFLVVNTIDRFVGNLGHNSVAPAVVIGSGYYFWLGERWTKKIAGRALRATRQTA
jgi:hypothetical protein